MPVLPKDKAFYFIRRFLMENIYCEKSKIFKNKAADILENCGVLPENLKNYVVLPGLCDVHVHFREPGFSYKETIKSGSESAAAGGYTAVCTMPNLNPVPDSKENLDIQLDIIDRDSLINIYPYGSISVMQKGEKLSGMDEMSEYVCAFSDDGKGVQDEDFMRSAMLKAKSLNKIIAAHCEDNSLLNGGYIHDGRYASEHSHKGISSESEYKQIERDLVLSEETGCAYHVCHISTKESVELIRQAKKRGVNVTCETAPHYLTLTEDDLKEDGRFKMNPPIRSALDRKALIEGLIDGTIDMIATDHAPHSIEEKSKGLKGSSMGIIGLETAFPVLYTNLVKTGIISMEKLTKLMCYNPRRRFGIPLNEDYTVFEISKPYTIDPKTFKTKGRATPFANTSVYGRCVLTVCGGKTVYNCIGGKQNG